MPGAGALVQGCAGGTEGRWTLHGSPHRNLFT
jgi:hypothetical protein